jgi:hypothetical protein
MEYKKYQFCKAVKCECLIPPSEINDIWEDCIFDNPGDCIYTAKEFHQWLKTNGFVISKQKECPEFQWRGTSTK